MPLIFQRATGFCNTDLKGFFPLHLQMHIQIYFDLFLMGFLCFFHIEILVKNKKTLTLSLTSILSPCVYSCTHLFALFLLLHAVCPSLFCRGTHRHKKKKTPSDCNLLLLNNESVAPSI